jgi:hypothetical protein
MNLGKKIEELFREEVKKGKTIKDVCKEIGFSDPTYYRILDTNKTDTETLSKISRHFKLPMSYFVDELGYLVSGQQQTIGDNSSGQYFNAQKIMSEKNEQNEGKSTSNEKLYNELISYKEKVADLERLVKSKDETIASQQLIIELLKQSKTT